MGCDEYFLGYHFYLNKIFQFSQVINQNKNIIISAHGNSIRAIVMEIFNLNSEQILKTEIGWCEPWIISFDNHGKLSNHQILKHQFQDYHFVDQ